MRRTEVDPLVAFAFTVEMQKTGDGVADKPEGIARFSGVDGLSYEVEMIEYRDAASPNLPKFRQGRRKAGRVTLKRGLGVDNGSDNLVSWLRECESGTIVPRNLTITVDHVEEGSKVYELLNCRPTKWSLSSLDGNSSSVAIESVELVVEETKTKAASK